MGKNWKENRNLNNVSWKTKKHIAEAVCVFAVVFSMVLSLCAPAMHQMKENAVSRESVNYQIKNGKTSVNLKLDSTQIKSDAVNLPPGTSEKKDILADTKENGTRNRIVQDVVYQTGADIGKNIVVKNPAPLSLASAIFEDYGQLPELGEVATRYQYPVEIGYAVERNYDGRQTQKDTILNMVMDTIPEEVSDDDTKEGDKEDSVKETSSEVTEEEDTEEDGLDSDDKKRERDVREAFRKEIWRRILVTEPVEVQTEENLQVEERKTEPEEDKESREQELEEVEDEPEAEETEIEDIEDAESTAEAKPEEDEEKQDAVKDTNQPVITDAGYYIISGMMRDGKDAFVSDIQIKPSGVDGFNKIRLGKDGKFMDSVLITEDAADKNLELYFTDGERVTTKTVFTYTKDTQSPEIAADEEDIKILSSQSDSIYCSSHPDVAVIVKDGEQGKSAGIEKISSVFGNKIVCLVDTLEKPRVTLPQEFYGRVLLNCEDRAGNTSDIISQYYLVEQTAPEVTFSDSEICTAPYTLWIDVADTGHIISGIDNIECTVNGEHCDIMDLTAQENVQLTDSLTVPSKAGFSLSFDKEGSYQIAVQVTDHAGNITTEEKTIEVTQPELVAIYMPPEFTIHIDPQRLLGREQIFSDNITLTNVSNVDVEVQIEDIVVTVNKEESDTGMIKDCDIFLVAPDTGEKIPLNKGNNKNLYSYCLPVNAEGKLAELSFVGDTTEGSDAMWRDSDITIDVKLRFDKWRE